VRYYDPSTGQFLTVDPLVAVTGQSYAYTGDDPVNGVDPMGLCTIPGEGQLYPGACATTGAEAIAAEQEIQAQAQGGGFSISKGLDAVEGAASDVGHFVATHKTAIAEVAVGVVIVVGATVLTGGLADALLESFAAAEAEGGLGGAFESVDLAVHAPFVLLPGATLGAMGLGIFGYGVYSLFSGQSNPCE
jgi:hypothetical protein